jgi:general secretion pathway protein G
MSRKRKFAIREARRGGFTLMEVLLVLAILVILASVSILGVTQYMTRANNQTAELKINALKTAIDAFFLGEGRHPQSLDELLVMSPKTKSRYVETQDALLDPWQRQINYQPPTQVGSFAEYRLWSLGADGQDGTDDDISNVTQ